MNLLANTTAAAAVKNGPPSSRRMLWLTWAAALIAAWALLLDWHDELAPLKSEAQAAQARQQRELAVIGGVNWAVEAARARGVRLEWLGRLLEADTPALLRVIALDHFKTLCDEAKAGCQISLVGEDGEAAAPDTGSRRMPEGVRAVRLKLVLNFAPELLAGLLRRIEADDKLKAIERVFIAGPRAELELSVFGIDAGEARRIRAGTGAGS